MVDLSKYIDNSLKQEFDKKPFDAPKARATMVAGIKRAAKQFADTKEGTTPLKAPNRWWKRSGDVVAFTAKMGVVAVKVSGEEVNYIPYNHFVNFLTDFEASVNAGDFDDILEEVSNKASVKKEGSHSSDGKTDKRQTREYKMQCLVGSAVRFKMTEDTLKSRLYANYQATDEEVKQMFDLYHEKMAAESAKSA